jgi:hypothetical protein
MAAQYCVEVVNESCILTDRSRGMQKTQGLELNRCTQVSKVAGLGRELSNLYKTLRGFHRRSCVEV